MKDYQIIVPIDSRNFRRSGAEKTVARLRELGVNRVLVAIGAYYYDAVKRAEQMKRLRENLDYLRNEGFDCGVWLWAYMSADAPFARMVGTDGHASGAQCCPLEPEFLDFAADYIREVARMKPSLILFDDDLRFGHFDVNLACFCERHIADVSARLGESIDRETLARYVFTGEENKYRTAWHASLGDTVRTFARRMRETVDSVDPTIRMGQCACITTWDIDGADSAEISRILAGSTKPYLRLIGAAYWAGKFAWGSRIGDVIELERMQLTWARDGLEPEIEVVSEGDVYPRPRWIIPSAYLEALDTALRVSGGFDGIQKYMLDYTASVDFEKGYADRHIANKSLYAEIDELFADKKSVGLRVYESREKFCRASLSGSVQPHIVQDMLFSAAARTTSANGMATTYEGVCAGIAFGENAKHLSDAELASGLILDLPAALFLRARGVDVGIESVGEYYRPEEEHYFVSRGFDDEYVPASGAWVNRLTLKPDTQVMSRYVDGEVDTYPSSWRYEDENGRKFYVLNLDPAHSDEYQRRNYCRQRQLADALEWLGADVPAICLGNPDLYMQIKRGTDGKLAIGVWNFCLDPIEHPIIELATAFTPTRTIGCSAAVKSTHLELSRLEPFAFAAIEGVVSSEE